MKTFTLPLALSLLAGTLPLSAQAAGTGPQRDQVRKQDGSCGTPGTGTPAGTQQQIRKQDGSCGTPGTGTPGSGTQQQLRKRDGSCGSPAGTAGKSARKGR